MKKCIYCRKEKQAEEFSLEHVIPQFLGGAYAPDRFKIREVCKTCNNNLGLFVDASFEKNYLVYNTLKRSVQAFYNPQNPVGLPISCMGITEFTPPEMQKDEVCEFWIGPLGEQVYWVRPNDARLHYYSGGNPRTTKSVKSKAYFFFSELTHESPTLSWLSFRDAFEGRRVTKIMCTKVAGEEPKNIDFSEPDSVDERRIKYLLKVFSESPTRKLNVEIYLRYDQRFIAKLAIGVAYAFFGQRILSTPYMEELHKALWFREGNDTPLVNGFTALSGAKDEAFDQLTGEENGPFKLEVQRS